MHVYDINIRQLVLLAHRRPCEFVPWRSVGRPSGVNLCL